MLYFPEFDPVIRGQYSHSLVNFTDERTGKHVCFPEGKERLKCKCKKIIKDLENYSGKNLREFVIGKTYAKLSDAKGIRSRWGEYKEKGFDGLVAIACITKENRPGNIPAFTACEKNGFYVDQEWQELYSIAFEQDLIKHFMLDEVDERIRNHSLNTGGKWKHDHHYGVVYLAYKLGEQDPESSCPFVDRHTMPDPCADHLQDLDLPEMLVQSSLQLESGCHDVCMNQMDGDMMDDDVLCSVCHTDSSNELVDRDTIPVSGTSHLQDLNAPDFIIQSSLKLENQCHDTGICMIQADMTVMKEDSCHFDFSCASTSELRCWSSCCR